MAHPSKKHPWPTRWNSRRQRYEVLIKERWVSMQRASVLRRRQEAQETLSRIA